MNGLEVFGAFLGVLNVALVVRRSVWNYPFGIAMVAVYAKVFYDARLYADAALQIYFLAMQVYGLRVWLRNRDREGLAVVETLHAAQRILAAVCALLSSLALGWLFATYTNAAAPWIDSVIAGFSVTAQMLMSFRKIENWVLWIIVDVLAAGLYAYRGLYASAALYGLFLAMATAGLLAWQKSLRAQSTGPVTA